ncbi:MAG: hypothetical protein M1824_001276 [Vezdaea acicularis]|nr:MAG: hypothetical protein M1824_001276 [Vezdaea acicularis]
MRLFRARPTLLSLLMTLLSTTQHTTANPIPQDEAADGSFELLERNLFERQYTVCGYWSTLTCSSGQYCTTVNGQASCAAGGATPAAFVATSQAAGGYSMSTYTYTTTGQVTVTVTTSYAVGGATIQSIAPTATTTVYNPAPSQASGCNGANGEAICGTMCCPAGQTCGLNGCTATASYGYAQTTTWNSYNPTTTYGPATRPLVTSSTAAFTPAISATATGIVNGPTATTSGGLSGGAIAGIVIGVIAGIILLIIICGCFCCVEAFEGLFNAFGLGRRRRRTETRVEERYSHHGSGSVHGGWFGRRPARVDRPPRKSGGGFGNMAAIGAGLAGLAVALGLKRRMGRNEKSSNGSSYYSSSYYDSSESSSSSDWTRRTRETRGSRR